MLDFPSDPTDNQQFLAQNDTLYQWVVPPGAWIIVADTAGQTPTGSGTIVLQTSPELRGNPIAPTPPTNDNDTSIATTEFVKAQNYQRVAASFVTPASAAAGAGLRVVHGAAPTAPVNGDMWTTTAGLFVRINGVTKTVTTT